MPHLNQLIEKYNKKGLEILCITSKNDSAGKKKTEEFIETTKLIAPVGYVAPSDYNSLFQSLGGKGVPFSALVDPKGKVVWTGHPGSFNEAMVEKHISGARLGSGGSGGGISFDTELPKAYSGISKGLSKGKVGANLAKIEKTLQNKRTSDTDKEALTTVKDEIRSFFDTEMKGIEGAIGESRYFDAVESLSVLAKHYKGHDLGKAAKTKHKSIITNKSLKDEIEAGKRIAKAKKDIEAGKNDKAKKGLKIITGGYLKTTKEAARAKRLIGEL
ncbi:MAG: hypothetical protein ACI97A_001520 [Planctomycetota bacterium]